MSHDAVVAARKAHADSCPSVPRFAERSALDHLVIGFLALFLFVYASELLILVPCGSFSALPACELPASVAQFWSSYFALDPLFAQMPPYYVTIMSLQDYLYNPWWIVCFILFCANRQDAPWVATLTTLVTGMIVATSLVIFGSQLRHPHYTANVLLALVLINGPWMFGPLLITWRLRHGNAPTPVRRAARSHPARASGLIALPTLAYAVACIVATAIA